MEMETIIEQGSYKDYNWIVTYDNDPWNPREDHWNLSKMICFHSRYSLGDDHNFTSPAHFHQWLKLFPELIVRPLYLYDHSGITISTKAFHCPWDSGQVGYAYVTKGRTTKAGLDWEDKDELLRQLEAEVNVYDAYLTGQVYRWTVEDHTGDNIDMCGGYYDDLTLAIEDAKFHCKHNWLHHHKPIIERLKEVTS